MATYPNKQIILKGHAGSGARKGVEVVIGGSPTILRDVLCVVTGLGANTVVTALTNGAVANIAASLEAVGVNPESLPASAFGTKTKMAVQPLSRSKEGLTFVIPSGGAAYNAATHDGLSRGVKKDANGFSYVDLTDAANPAVKIIRYADGPRKDNSGNYGTPKLDGTDTGVLLEVEIIESAAWAG